MHGSLNLSVDFVVLINHPSHVHFHGMINHDYHRSLIFLQYADPVCDLLDKHRVFKHRLFREHCVFFNGIYVKVIHPLVYLLLQIPL